MLNESLWWGYQWENFASTNDFIGGYELSEEAPTLWSKILASPSFVPVCQSSKF